MCGIVGYIGTRESYRVLLPALKKLEYRGYDSAGIATVAQGKLYLRKKTGTIEENDIGFSLPGTTGIGHTRWATHGGVTEANAHPHVSCNHDIAVVHNGTIDNYRELKKDLEAHGHVFRSDTDTEVIVHLIEQEMPGGLESAVLVAASRLRGSFAFLAMHCLFPDMLVAVRNDCPLLVGIGDGECVVASDVQAFDTKTQRVVECLPNKIYVVRRSGVRHRSPSGSLWPYEDDPGMTFDSVRTTSNKEGYNHFMLKEIMEQPSAIRSSINVDPDALKQAAADIQHSHQVVFTASGTSRYAAIVGRFIFSRTMERLGDAIASSEFHYFAGSLRRGTVVVAVSQSGETADVLHGINLAKQHGAYIVAITNNPNSQLGRISDVVVSTACGPEIGVAASKTFTGQLSVFYQLYGAMTGRLTEVQEEIRSAASVVDTVLRDNRDKIMGLAHEIKDSHDFYYLGRGINFAIAGESALKMKEISYVHAEGLSAGELKHGTLSLIDNGVPVCGICPDDFAYGETVLNLQEVKARGGLVIGVSDRYSDVFDRWISLPRLQPIYYPMVCVVPTQLLAYYLAVERNLNPDKPRNLAKSVTVR